MNEELEAQVTNDATSEIKANIIAYGEDALHNKFTSNIDGLKAIGRRILWFTRQYNTKTALGRLIGDLLVVHTSGDQSIYDAIIRLSQPFMIGHPLVTVYGNNGSPADPKSAAAYRYLSACLSDFARDIYYNGINLSTLPMTQGKVASISEPQHFIPKIPMALVLGNLSIVVGFKSDYPLIDFTDVCDLVNLFATKYEKGEFRVPHKEIAPHVIPKFPILNLVKNRKELLEAYSVGDYKATILLDGWAEINGNQIVLRSLPYGISFAEYTNKIRSDMVKDRHHWLFDYVDSVNDHSDKEARFTFNLKRGRNPFEVLEKLKKTVRFCARWKPITDYVRDGRVVSLTVPTLVEYWYHERADSIRNGLKYKQANLVFDKMRIQATLKIVDHVDTVVKMIRNANSEEEAVQALHAKFKDLTLHQAEMIVGQKLITLAKCSRAPLEEELDQVNADLETVNSSFDKVNETISSDALYLKKKYGSTSLTKFSDDFIGYVKFGNWGCINFFDLDDMAEILASKGWPGAIDKTIHFYDPKKPKRFIVKQNRLYPLEDLSRQILCEDIIQTDKDELTLAIGKGTASVIERIVGVSPEEYTLCPIAKKFYAIHRNGTISYEDTKNLAQRRSIGTGVKSDIIFGIPEKSANDVIVFYASTSEPNTVRCSHVLSSKEDLGRLKTVATGTTHILGVFPYETKLAYLNIPSSCRKANATEQLLIKQPKLLFEDGKPLQILNLGKGQINGVRISRHPEARGLFKLDMSKKK